MKAGFLGILGLATASCIGQHPDCEVRYPDADGDGFRAATGVLDCDAEASEPGEDCDDAEAEVNPGAAEICDGLDNDCDGDIDSDDADIDSVDWYADADGDGFGDAEQIVQGKCEQPASTAAEAGDCDDNDAEIRPGALDVCADGVDQDCDNVEDCALSGDLDAASAAAQRWSGGVVAAVGDVSGDGVADAAIGDPGQDRVTVITGGSQGASAAATLEGDGAFGSAVAGVDADGDGDFELAIGAPEAGSSSQGEVVVVWDPMVGDEVGVVEGKDNDEQAGTGLAVLGSGSDAMLGAVCGAIDSDGVFTGWHLRTFSSLPSNGATASTKDSKARFGLFNVADGWPLSATAATLAGEDSLVVGASSENSGAGGAYAWPTTTTGTSTSSSASLKINGAADGDALGAALATGDDLLLIGAPDTTSGRGKVYLFQNPPASGALDVEDADATLSGAAGAHLGAALALFDLNGDGALDLAVSAPGKGQVEIYLGPLEDGLPTAYATLKGSAGFGAALAAADLNDDGADDLLVSDGADTWLFYGGP